MWLKDERVVCTAVTQWNVAYSFEFQIIAKLGSFCVGIEHCQSKVWLLRDHYSYMSQWTDLFSYLHFFLMAVEGGDVDESMSVAARLSLWVSLDLFWWINI